MLNKKEQRLRRSRQTRARIAKQDVARLTVFRSNLHIYASVISEDGARVVASASTAVVAATSPALWPPTPSATMNSRSSTKLPTASSLERRFCPACV